VSIFRIAALLGLGAAVTGAAPPPLAGIWGAPGSMLTIDAQGARLEQDCASGSFGPVRADAKGRFKARGRFDLHQPGPQRADSPAGAAAVFSGAIKGDQLVLSIEPAGGRPQIVTLTKGRRVKLIRCY
jgi:hypothetical protein